MRLSDFVAKWRARTGLGCQVPTQNPTQRPEFWDDLFETLLTAQEEITRGPWERSPRGGRKDLPGRPYHRSSHTSVYMDRYVNQTGDAFSQYGFNGAGLFDITEAAIVVRRFPDAVISPVADGRWCVLVRTEVRNV